MGLLGFLWDAYQQNQIINAADDIRTASLAARSATDEARRMQAQLDHLSMVNMALWSIVRERLNLSDDDLAERVKEIDLSDGNLDGRIAGGTKQCGNCGRTMATRHARCIYCGGEPV